MFNKKKWVKNNLKSGFDKGLWTAEHIMENAMKYSMAGVLDDTDLAELALYTVPVIEETETEIAEGESAADETIETPDSDTPDESE